MATAFTCFPRLPTELRLRIWELALKPEMPTVNFFPLHGAGLEGPIVLEDASPQDSDDDGDDNIPGEDNEEEMEWDGQGEEKDEREREREREREHELDLEQAPDQKSQGRETSGEEACPCGCPVISIGVNALLAIHADDCEYYRHNHHRPNPSSINDQPFSTDNTSSIASGSIVGRSAHLWDIGLWQACAESRAVVSRHYTHAFSAADPRAQVPLNGLIPPWRISLNPLRDLACLSLPRRAWTEPTTKRTIPNTFRNLAMIIDPSWPTSITASHDLDSLGTEHGPRAALVNAITAIAMSGRFEPVIRRKLWLIDPHIRLLPNHRVLWGLEGRSRFYGLDCVFVECVREVCAPTGRRGRNTAFDLFDFMHEYFDGELRNERHLANIGRSLDACLACELDNCPDDDFRLHEIFGILAPVQN